MDDELFVQVCNFILQSGEWERQKLLGDEVGILEEIVQDPGASKEHKPGVLRTGST